MNKLKIGFVYRYIPIYRLWEILEKKEIYFFRNSKWEDPFEGFLARAFYEKRGIDYEGTRKLRYFLCCTELRDADHLWKIYTPNKDGVRLKISIPDLVNCEKSMECMKILYKTRSNLSKRYKKMEQDGGYVNELYFYKRVAFKSEEEIRFMIQKGYNDDVLPVKIDPKKVFLNLMFDPRMERGVYKSHKEFINFKYPDLKIYQSSLYNPEKAMTGYL